MDATETVMEGEAPKSAMRHLTKATAATPSVVDGARKDGKDKLDERNLVMEEAVEADMAFKENNTPLKSTVNQSKGKKRAAAAPSPSSATKKGRSAIKVDRMPNDLRACIDMTKAELQTACSLKNLRAMCVMASLPKCDTKLACALKLHAYFDAVKRQEAMECATHGDAAVEGANLVAIGLDELFDQESYDVLRRDEAAEAAAIGVATPAPGADMQVNATLLLPPLVMSSDGDSATAAQHEMSVKAACKRSSVNAAFGEPCPLNLRDLFPDLFREEYPRELGCYPRPFNDGGTLLDYDDFEDYAPIATGKATTVFKATHCSSGTVVAIKAIVRASMTYGACVNFRRAVEFGFHIQDPAVVPVFGWFYTTDKVFIVMEYCAKGDFNTVYPAPDPVAPWKVANVARQLVQGLKTIHGNGVAHRRLTFDNILVTEDGTVKIANFGGAARGKRVSLPGPNTNPPKEMKSDKCHSTPARQGTQNALAFSYVDVWSLGIVLFTLLSGAAPVTDAEGDTLLPLQFPDDMSVDGIDLITQILVDDETKRLSLSAIEAHAFLAMDN